MRYTKALGNGVLDQEYNAQCVFGEIAIKHLFRANLTQKTNRMKSQFSSTVLQQPFCTRLHTQVHWPLFYPFTSLFPLLLHYRGLTRCHSLSLFSVPNIPIWLWMALFRFFSLFVFFLLFFLFPGQLLI